MTIRKTLRTFSRKMAVYMPVGMWPRPHHSDEKPCFLFVITPSYSGSTALAEILNSCPTASFLSRKGEGQWLIPGLRAADRWERKKKIDWQSVRAVWLNRIDEIRALVQDVDIVIEKSPPNIVRIDGLVETFPNHVLLAFYRNPYANISSRMHRRRHKKEKSDKERLEMARRFAEEWVERQGWVKTWIEQYDVVHFSYEAFCKDPGVSLAPLVKQLPVLQSMDVNKLIKVKSYPPQPITNMNERQIDKLKSAEIQAINAVLQTHQDLLDYFGYSLIND
ncbi:MAG: sulfotransferase [bacterium]